MCEQRSNSEMVVTGSESGTPRSKPDACCRISAWQRGKTLAGGASILLIGRLRTRKNKEGGKISISAFFELEFPGPLRVYLLGNTLRYALRWRGFFLVITHYRYSSFNKSTCS